MIKNIAQNLLITTLVIIGSYQLEGLDEILLQKQSCDVHIMAREPNTHRGIHTAQEDSVLVNLGTLKNSDASTVSNIFYPASSQNTLAFNFHNCSPLLQEVEFSFLPGALIKQVIWQDHKPAYTYFYWREMIQKNAIVGLGLDITTWNSVTTSKHFRIFPEDQKSLTFTIPINPIDHSAYLNIDFYLTRVTTDVISKGPIGFNLDYQYTFKSIP